MIRKYEEKDLSSIIKLFYDTVHFINIKDYTQKQVNVWAPENIDKNLWNKSLLKHYSIVFEDNGIIKGFCDCDNEGYIDRLYVHKDFQNQGIGKKLIENVEEYILKNGVRKFYSHVSITAIPFFEKRGYKVVKKQFVNRNNIIIENFIITKNL